MPHLQGLYAITDDTLLAGRLLPAVAAALAGGCRIVQYRSKHGYTARQLDEASALAALCRRHDAWLLVNDYPELARRCGAHGVHLGQGDTALADARALLGPDAIIGITCHADLDLARAAAAGGANYVAFGRFFPSGTKPDAPPAPLSLLRAARGCLPVPLVAIGGITLDNAACLRRAGADALAVAGDLFGAPDILSRARAYTTLLEGLAHDPL